MNQPPLTLILSVALTLVSIAATRGQSNTPSQHEKTFDNWMFTTPAYNNEALRLVIQEANRVAEELQLPGELPITKSNILQCFITPYAMVRHADGAIGNITTSNYTYCVSVDGKFSFLERCHHDGERAQWVSEYSQPVSYLDPKTGQQVFETNTAFQLLDTNAAYQLATQWLADVSMDVKGLNRDYTRYIHPTLIWGQRGELRFLPLYNVYWTKGPDGYGSQAFVELFLPTKTLVQLRVIDSKYILRKPLKFKNLDSLLSQTNASFQTEVAPVEK